MTRVMTLNISDGTSYKVILAMLRGGVGNVLFLFKLKNTGIKVTSLIHFTTYQKMFALKINKKVCDLYYHNEFHFLKRNLTNDFNTLNNYDKTFFLI